MKVNQQQLQELLSYDPSTGDFIWRPRGKEWFDSERIGSGWNTKYANKQAGHLNKSLGYLEISVLGVKTLAHRWAWLYVHGYMPECDIDHLNHNRADNRLANLRLATDAENQQNLPLSKANTSGFTGVDWDARKGKWRVQACFNNRHLFGGYFNSKDAAIARRQQLNADLGFHQNHGIKVAA